MEVLFPHSVDKFEGESEQSPPVGGNIAHAPMLTLLRDARDISRKVDDDDAERLYIFKATRAGSSWPVYKVGVSEAPEARMEGRAVGLRVGQRRAAATAADKTTWPRS